MGPYSLSVITITVCMCTNLILVEQTNSVVELPNSHSVSFFYNSSPSNQLANGPKIRCYESAAKDTVKISMEALCAAFGSAYISIEAFNLI